MIKVLLRQRIACNAHGAGQKDANLCFGIKMPFAPAVGMKITRGDIFVCVHDLWWDMNAEVLHCFSQLIRSADGFQATVDEHKRYGWVEFNGDASSEAYVA